MKQSLYCCCCYERLNKYKKNPIQFKNKKQCKSLQYLKSIVKYTKLTAHIPIHQIQYSHNTGITTLLFSCVFRALQKARRARAHWISRGNMFHLVDVRAEKAIFWTFSGWWDSALSSSCQIWWDGRTGERWSFK